MNRLTLRRIFGDPMNDSPNRFRHYSYHGSPDNWTTPDDPPERTGFTIYIWIGTLIVILLLLRCLGCQPPYQPEPPLSFDAYTAIIHDPNYSAEVRQVVWQKRAKHYWDRRNEPVWNE